MQTTQRLADADAQLYVANNFIREDQEDYDGVESNLFLQ